MSRLTARGRRPRPRVQKGTQCPHSASSVALHLCQPCATCQHELATRQQAGLRRARTTRQQLSIAALRCPIKANKDYVAHIKRMRMAQELAPAEEVAEAVKLLREESAGCPLEEQVSTACIACCSALPSVRLSPCEHVAMCDRCDASFAKRMGQHVSGVPWAGGVAQPSVHCGDVMGGGCDARACRRGGGRRLRRCEYSGAAGARL